MNSDKVKERAASDLILEAEILAKNIVEKATRTASRLVEDRDEEDRLLQTLDRHFEEDNERFKKLTELATINGDHLSYFNKNLMEVKQMLIEQNRVSENQYRQMKPIIDKFEANTQGIAWIKSKGMIAISVAGAVITIAGAWYIIVNFIKNSIDTIK